MQINNIEITLLSLLYCILVIVMITTNINFNTNNQFSQLYIQAENKQGGKKRRGRKDEEG